VGKGKVYETLTNHSQKIKEVFLTLD